MHANESQGKDSQLSIIKERIRNIESKHDMHSIIIPDDNTTIGDKINKIKGEFNIIEEHYNTTDKVEVDDEFNSKVADIKGKLNQIESKIQEHEAKESDNQKNTTTASANSDSHTDSSDKKVTPADASAPAPAAADAAADAAANGAADGAANGAPATPVAASVASSTDSSSSSDDSEDETKLRVSKDSDTIATPMSKSEGSGASSSVDTYKDGKERLNPGFGVPVTSTQKEGGASIISHRDKLSKILNIKYTHSTKSRIFTITSLVIFSMLGMAFATIPILIHCIPMMSTKDVTQDYILMAISLIVAIALFAIVILLGNSMYKKDKSVKQQLSSDSSLGIHVSNGEKLLPQHQTDEAQQIQEDQSNTKVKVDYCCYSIPEKIILVSCVSLISFFAIAAANYVKPYLSSMTINSTAVENIITSFSACATIFAVGFCIWFIYSISLQSAANYDVDTINLPNQQNTVETSDYERYDSPTTSLAEYDTQKVKEEVVVKS